MTVTQPSRPTATRPPETGAWQWGRMPGWFGITLITGAAALAALATALTGTGPGAALGVCLLIATLAACLAVQRRAVYLLIPAPALAYAVAAAIAGLASSHSAGASHTALAVNAARWIASGFLAMTAATLLAITITATRWPRRPHAPGP